MRRLLSIAVAAALLSGCGSPTPTESTPTKDSKLTATSSPSPAALAPSPTPSVQDSPDEVALAALRASVPDLDSVSDETVRTAAQGACDAVTAEPVIAAPGALRDAFIAGFAESAGLTTDEAAAFLVGSVAWLCPEHATQPGEAPTATVDPADVPLMLIRGRVPSADPIADHDLADLAQAVCDWVAADPTDGAVDAALHLMERGIAENEAPELVAYSLSWKCPDA